MQKIPAVLVKALVPLLISQADELSNLTELISDKVSALPLSINMKCNDPRVNEIKDDLKKLANLVSAIQLSLTSIDKILILLTTIGRLAKVFKLVGLSIPAVPGVPVGSATTIITKFSETGINCLSAVECLQNVLSTIQLEFGRVSDVMAKSTNVLGSICNNQIFNVSADTQKKMNSLDKVNLGLSANISSANFNNRLIHDTGNVFYPGAGEGFESDSNGIYINNNNVNRTYISKFYNEHNVSDVDINEALQLLNNLYAEQKNTINNILSDRQNMSAIQRAFSAANFKQVDLGTPESRALLQYRESPSNVYFGKSIIYGTSNQYYPSLTGNADDIFIGGKPDDFFIDVENKVIFGPKESETNWGQPIKY